MSKRHTQWGNTMLKGKRSTHFIYINGQQTHQVCESIRAYASLYTCVHVRIPDLVHEQYMYIQTASTQHSKAAGYTAIVLEREGEGGCIACQKAFLLLLASWYL